MWTRLWNSEPAILTAAGSVLFWQTLFEGFSVFGHPFTSAQQSWLGGVGVAVATWIIRQQVTSKATLEDLRPSTLATAQAASVPVRDTVKKLPSFFLAVALGSATMVSTGCIPKPPAGTYTQAQLQTYNSVQLIADLQALSDTAINLNAATGREHLSDLNTSRIRNFTLSAGATLNSAGVGSTDLQAIRDGFLQLTRQIGDVTQTQPTLAKILAAVQAGLNALPQ